MSKCHNIWKYIMIIAGKTVVCLQEWLSMFVCIQ